MPSGTALPRKYEEYAYVLDYVPHGRSSTIKGREGAIVQAIGEDWLTLLEILAMNRIKFEAAERIYIGREGRTKVISVLGRLRFEELTEEAKDELPPVCEMIVSNNEKKFVAYFNELQPITPRLHALELIPGIGKTFMLQILEERERRPFESFEDLQNRVGLRYPAKLVAKRLVEEISGEAKVNIFVRR